jgi:hypothetical protein
MWSIFWDVIYHNGRISIQELLLTALEGFDLWSIIDWNGGNYM